MKRRRKGAREWLADFLCGRWSILLGWIARFDVWAREREYQAAEARRRRMQIRLFGSLPPGEEPR